MRFPGLRLLLFGAPRSASSVHLGHRRIFILPTRLGMWFGFLLLAMLFTAMNYQNNLAYALTFLAVSAALTSALHTYANLAGITLSPGTPPPVFAGQGAGFPVRLTEQRGVPRLAVEIGAVGAEVQSLDIPPSGGTSAWPGLPTQARGILPSPELVVRTRHPLGLFQAWSKMRFSEDCLVYPRPAPEAEESGVLRPEGPGIRRKWNATGEEDLDSLREYRSGESYKRIDWKAYARGRGLVSKQFSGADRASVWLDFEALPEVGVEARLALLARMILDQEEAGTMYGLKLPGSSLAPDSGPEHMHACLAELALFQPSEQEREETT
ncbi:MAG: DUF58 domain-containing protein [Desulfohalobiaceae bacterium]|nr:DUF58 domain-containing protein [Desulfohalobiaceae bacterium]